MARNRQELLKKVWDAQDEAYELMVEYDSLPHHYGEAILYQAEGEIIDLIAIHPGVTITDLGNILKKTASACSQIVRKLREKGWVEQTRNRENNRVYNLTLTETGMQIYQGHQAFTQNCRDITFELLGDFSEEELETYLRVQEKLNEAYHGDVKRSRERFIR
ncbi:MarR family winged helix-turn-helix transcriptional regulator [Vermiculatibacterium agrestimuris]|uniref:MarR family winged helix-turn-helix transcriptional regulator n=1 Tax=Vermiculatibacterium agrestimuris TaxID=2941519 RepID=UPI002042140C|nr:MarR family transcriptional regulator [Vermiculatibacterium agrestimuris]